MTTNPLPPDPYAALGVTRSSTLQEIRSAHRKLVLKCHPDKVQDPTLKAKKQDEFQKVQQAYEILSNDDERQKYDDMVKLDELRKEAAARYPMNSSAARTPPRPTAHYNVNIRTAEPRSSSFAKSSAPPPPPQANAKFYAQSSHPRSYEESIYSSGARSYTEEPRKARRPSSYEDELPSRREKDRSSKEKERRRREDELIRREEEKRAEQKAEARREKEKEREREFRKKEKKEREAREKQEAKDRRKMQDEQRHQRQAYVEEPAGYEEVYPAPRADKKSSRKHEPTVRETEIIRDAPKREKSKNRDEKPNESSDKFDKFDKVDQALGFAQSYLRRAKAASTPRVQVTRSQTEYAMPTQAPPIAVPTPPPASKGMPMPSIDEDTARRSSAKAFGRRSSHDSPKSSKDKSSSSHKKSSTPRETGPVVVDAASPSSRMPPSFIKNHSAPPVVPDSPPREARISRAKTEYAQARPPLPPQRAQTWYPGAGEDTHERSRPSQQPYYSDEDSEDDRHHRRSTRRRQSPEPMPQRSYSYRVDDKTGRTKVQEARYPAEDYSPKAYYDGYSGGGHFKPTVGRSFTQDDVSYAPVNHAPQDHYHQFPVSGY